MSQSEQDRVRSVLHEMLESGSVARPPVGPAELRSRTTRRYVPRVDAKVVFALAAAVVVVVALLAFGAHRNGPATSATASTIKGGSVAHSLSLRPVLCYAPPVALPHGGSPSTGPLPACSPSSQLTAANLQVTPDTGNVNGYTANTAVPADPAFATYASTSPSGNQEGTTVLLPGISGLGTNRYVLGPAGLQLVDGQWSVDVTLTGQGSAAWDVLAHQQFHQIVGVDIDGTVISAPIIQPTHSSFSSFDGQMQISGGFPEAQALAIAQAVMASR
jgi:hypothetical protein